MDVIVPYGINFKKCSSISFSGYKKTQIIPFLEKNLIEKKSEIVMALVAELHCSSFFNELNNFIIYYFSNYLSISSITLPYFIVKHFQKINNISSNLPKKQRQIAIINSNEIRNIYCSLFSQLIENKINKFNIKLENKCYQDEIHLMHANLKSYNLVFDTNNIPLSDKLSRGLREILYWIDNPKLDVDTMEKILYWIHWCIKIESLEKKIYNGIIFTFNSENPILEKIKKKNGWEFFLWIKIWQSNHKNHYLNKNILKSLTKMFFLNYNRSKLKERSGIIALAILLCNYQNKIKITRNISKMEIFISLNANQFYKNIQIDDDNDEKYLESYNTYNNIKSKENIKELYKINSMEKKMDFLREYIPKEETKKLEDKKSEDNHKKISEYFS